MNIVKTSQISILLKFFDQINTLSTCDIQGNTILCYLLLQKEENMENPVLLTSKFCQAEHFLVLSANNDEKFIDFF
jgi:hypothetical protein